MHNENFFNRPVFITGFNKSGTTLLLSLLDWHAKLLVFPEELHFCRTVLLSKHPRAAMRNDTGIRMFLGDEYMQGWSQGKSWNQDGYPGFDKAGFCRSLDRMDIQPGGVGRWRYLQSVLHEFARKAGMPNRGLTRWVSKTTQNEVHFPLIQRVFRNDAQWLYVVRDPRDVFTSLLKRAEHAGEERQSPERSLIEFASVWQQQVRVALKYAGQSNRFRLIRYEDLLSDAENVMKGCAEFLGVQFDRSMLQPTRCGQPWGGTPYTRIVSMGCPPPRLGNIGRSCLRQ